VGLRVVDYGNNFIISFRWLLDIFVEDARALSEWMWRAWILNLV